MKVYLAAGFSKKEIIADRTRELRELGVEVTSTWPWETASAASNLGDVSNEYSKENAFRDIQEIREADTLILFTQDPTIPFVRGGRMHEAGYAHGLGHRIIVVGPRENIFHYLENVEVYSDWENFKEVCLRVEKTTQAKNDSTSSQLALSSK